MQKIVLVLFISLSVLACTHRVEPIYNADLSVPPKAKMEDIPQAIKSALIARGWTIQKEEKDLIESQILVRSHSAGIRIPFDEKFVRIKYVSSVHLLYSQEGGTQYIHHNYNKWIRLLERGVDFSSGRAGIAARIRYAFGTPSRSKRRGTPDAMPQRQHTPR